MTKPKKQDTSAAPEQTALDMGEMYSFADLNPALEKMYSEMGMEGEGQANVYITKLLTDGREAKIWQGQPSDYDLMTIARKFGSGDYRVKVYVQHESGRFVMRGNTVFPVMLEPGEDARIELLRSGQQLSAGGAPSVSAADIARAVAEAVKAAIPVPVAPANNLGMLKEVAEIVRTLAPQQQNIAPAFNPLDMLKIMSEVLRDSRESDPIERGVNATGTDVFLRLIDKFAPMFNEVLTRQNGNPVALPAPSDAIMPVSGADKAVMLSQEDQAMNAMKMGLSFLVSQAAAKSDPGLYAEVVLDNVPDESLKQFLDHLQPLEYLAQFDPRVKQYVPWFTELIEAVKEEMKAEDAPSGAGSTESPVDATAKPS